MKLHKSIKPVGRKSKKIKVESDIKSGSSNGSNSNNNNITHQGGADNVIDLLESNSEDNANNKVRTSSLPIATVVKGDGTGDGNRDGARIGATATASFGAAAGSVAGSKAVNNTDKANKNRTNPLRGCKKKLNTGKREHISDSNTS